MIGRWSLAAGSSARGTMVLALALGVAGPALAAWPNDPAVNLPLCTATGDQASVASVSDGAAGVISAWRDTRSGIAIYAQRALGGGSVSPTWPANGLQVCLTTGDRTDPTLVGDGSGGAIIVWTDWRSVPSGSKVYAQHALASGTVDPAWPVNGCLLANVTGNQSYPVAVADGAGGAVVAWNDQRAGNADVYAQHVLSNGTLDPAWPATGRGVATNADDQWFPVVAPDGAGGVLLAWQDHHFMTNVRIFAHHLKANGTLDAAWPAAGCVVCAAGDLREHARLVGDGSGGAIVTWQDGRSGTNYDIYAHHVRSTGTVDPGWPADGRAVCDTVSDQLTPTLESDRAGGAIIAWEDYRSGAGADIYARRVRANGILDPGWHSQGVGLCVAIDDQVQPAIAVDGNGNAIVAWEDHRNVSGADIYAARVLVGGALDLAWTANGVGVSTELHDQFSPTALADGAGGLVACWVDARGVSGSYDVYAQRVTSNGIVGGSVVGVPRRLVPANGLALACPNPVRGGMLTVSVTLADDAGARLELLDLSGRRIAARDLGPLGPGGHTIDLAAGQTLSTGIYFLRLEQAGSQISARVAVLH